MKFKARLKRIMAGSLSVLMLATSIPMTSFAEDPGFGANAGGDQSQTVGGKGTGTKFRAVQQGLRFTVVDRDLHAVSNSVDFVMKHPKYSQYGNMLNTSYKFMNSRGDGLTRFKEGAGVYIKEGTSGNNATDRLNIVTVDQLKRYLDGRLDELGDFQKADGTPLNTGLSTEISGFASNDGREYYGEDIKSFLMRGDIFAEGVQNQGSGDAEYTAPPIENESNDGGNSNKPSGGSSSKPSGGGSSGGNKNNQSSQAKIDETVRGYVDQARADYASHRNSSLSNKKSYAQYMSGLGNLQRKWILQANDSSASASVKNDTKLAISKLWYSFNDRVSYENDVDAQARSEAPKTTSTRAASKKQDETKTVEQAVAHFKNRYKSDLPVTYSNVSDYCNNHGLKGKFSDVWNALLKAKCTGDPKNPSKSKREDSKKTNTKADAGGLLDRLFGVMTVYADDVGQVGPGGGSGNDRQPEGGPEGDTSVGGENGEAWSRTNADKNGSTVIDGFETVKNEDLLYTANGEPFNGWLKDIINWQPDGSNWLFQIDGMTAKSNALEMIDKDYLVIVEPIIYSNYKGSTWNSGETIYGTLSNIVDILGQEGRPNYIVQSWGPNYAYNALKLNNDYETQDGRLFKTSGREGWVSISDLYADYRKGGNEVSGSMMQLYTTASFPADSSSINTWDKENYPEEDGPSPDPSDKKEETSYNDKSKTFKIVKYYEHDIGDGKGYIPYSYYGVTENPHRVIVQSEDSFKCVGYFTSTKEESFPTNGEDASKYVYGDQKTKYGDGKYKGNGPGTVTVKPEDPDIVLHVLLRYEDPQVAQVIKIYESDGVTDKVKMEEVIIRDSKYEIVTPDGGYNYTESTQEELFVEDEPGSWADVPQDNHSVDKTITVPDTTHTIYIHYVQGGTTATPIILYENELSHNFSTAQLVENKIAINWQFPNKYSSGGSHHHDYDDDGDCHGYTCSWHTELSDSDYRLEVANTFDYGATSFIGSGGLFVGSEAGKISTSSSEKSSDISGFTTEDIVPEWKFVGYRDHNQDKVTLYPNKNGADIKSELNSLGIVSEGSKPAGTRVDTEDGGSWYNTFQTGYNYTSNNDKYLSSKGTGCSTHQPGTEQYSGTESATAQDLNTAYSAENNMKTYYYLGLANSGLSTVDTTNNAINMLNKTFNKYMSSNTKNENHVKFYPYIKMKYQTFGNGDKDAYVTSENLSDILIANRVEVGFNKEGSGPNLQLESTQWSTHSKSLAGLSDNGIGDKNSVLPGGAALTLKAGQNGTKTTIGIRTWQTVVPDELKAYLADGSQILTKSEAESQYNSFISDAKDVLEHYQVVQWATKGMSKNISEFEEDSNKKLVSGNGAVTAFEGQQLAKDSKYYLKVDGTGADRADIDILSENSKKTIWTIKSDTDGNVSVEKDGAVVASINQIQGVGLLLQNEEIKLLNDKTKLVENYISAIDRNKGRSRENKKWYNEAFDGLSVICNEWEAELGFSSTNPVRSTILDTKLCGLQDERRDAYNFDTSTIKDKVRTSIFMTSAKSTSGKAAGKPDGYLGTLGDIQIRINGIEEMFASKPFYIPNATVTDLN